MSQCVEARWSGRRWRDETVAVVRSSSDALRANSRHGYLRGSTASLAPSSRRRPALSPASCPQKAPCFNGYTLINAPWLIARVWA